MSTPARSRPSSTPTKAPTTANRLRKPSLLEKATPAKLAVPTNATRPLWSSSKVNVDSTPARRAISRPMSALGTTGKPPPVNAMLLKNAVKGLGVAVPQDENRRLCRTSGESVEVVEEEIKVKIEGDKMSVAGYNPAREPIKAYLRIRPAPSSSDAMNYIQVVNESEVLMVPPPDHRLNPSVSSSIFGGPLLRSAARNLDPASETPVAPGTLYKFTRVFPSADASTTNAQHTFFKETTLPLVQDFLSGQNCLLFAYGSTGSGKTFTVQGGAGEDAGVLPRAIDVILSSVRGKNGRMDSFGDTETIPVDRNYDYTVSVSSVEIYNEKVYDLLDSPTPTPVASSASSAHSATSIFSSSMGFLGAKAKAFGLKGLQSVKRTALSLKYDSKAGNKYVHGMKEVLVETAEEARELLERGQANRRVFSTLANRASSRSHSVFTIKVIRVHKTAHPDDPTAIMTNRFSIVDLAGSERVVNTQTSGDRLKEAGNINKSLMVLGQCMEVMRKNQELEKGRKPALVPFRHSKLTELFQSSFVGDGKAAMIVNVNPFETGFDENSHVMKFSAVAKEIMTIKNTLPILPEVEEEEVRLPRVIRLSMIDGGEEHDIVYEEEDAEDSDAGEDDEFVDALFQEINDLRATIYENEMQSLLAESRAIAKVNRECERKLAGMERIHEERMNQQILEGEDKLDQKLDILLRLQAKTAAAAAASPAGNTTYDDSDEYEEDEEEDSDEEVEVEKMLLDEVSVVGAQEMESGMDGLSIREAEEEQSPSILAARMHIKVVSPASPTPIITTRKHIPLIRDDSSEEEEETQVENESDSEEVSFEVPLAGEESSFEIHSEDDNAAESSEEEEEYVPESKRASRNSTRAPTAATPKPSASKKKVVVGKENERRDMIVKLKGGEDSDDDMISIKSTKKKRKLGGIKTKDAEDIDAFAESISPPATLQRSSSVKSLHKSASMRSLNKR